jgi:hypothetical protein
MTTPSIDCQVFIIRVCLVFEKGAPNLDDRKAGSIGSYRKKWYETILLKEKQLKLALINGQ